MTPAIPHYTDVPAGVAEHLADDEDPAFADQVRERLQHFASVQSRPGNRDGDLEAVGDTEVTHRFVDAPGDSETVRWHLVEAGQGEPVVSVHGLPDSWYMWHRQLAALAATHRVIAVDLKGYGQSDKRTGDYRAEGVAEQLIALLDALGVDQFDLVAHDRGSVTADHIGAAWPARVLRYIRGEQHLWHFNPALAPQELLFTDPDRARILDQPHALVLAAYTLLATKPVEDADLARTIQEFAYPKISWAVPRYFNSSSFRKEWLDRRQRLIARWTFPTLVLQGSRGSPPTTPVLRRHRRTPTERTPRVPRLRPLLRPRSTPRDHPCHHHIPRLNIAIPRQVRRFSSVRSRARDIRC